MIEKLEKRKERERKAISQHGDSQTIPDADFFRRMGDKIKVTKK